MTTARDIMHPGAQCIGEDESLHRAAQLMRDLEVGSLPVCGKDDRLHGMVTDRDIVIRCCAEGRTPSEMMAGILSDGTPHWVDAGSDIREILRVMEEHKIRRLPVIDDHRLVGMISEADVARNLPEADVARFVESVYAPA